MAMIEIKNLNKWYGNFQVLKNCNVTVERAKSSWSAALLVRANRL